MIYFWGVRNLGAPVVEITGGALKWRIPTQIRPFYKELPVGEVRSASWSDDSHRKLTVETKSGRSVHIKVSAIDESRRDEVRDAISAKIVRGDS
jgi:hypothetical protein